MLCMKKYGYSATINVKVTPGMKTALRILAASEDVMVSDLVRAALRGHFGLLDNGLVDDRLNPGVEAER